MNYYYDMFTVVRLDLAPVLFDIFDGLAAADRPPATR
jgi:hypothetical protein